jgi:hypothetical protein
MDRRYVGIDLHRRESMVYAMDSAGDRLFCERITNDALRFLERVRSQLSPSRVDEHEERGRGRGRGAERVALSRGGSEQPRLHDHRRRR